MKNGIWEVGKLIFGIVGGLAMAGTAITGYHDYSSKVNPDKPNDEDRQALPESSEEDTTSEDN